MKTSRSKIVMGFASVLFFVGIYLMRKNESQIISKKSSALAMEHVPAKKSDAEDRIEINKAGSHSLQNSKLEKLESESIEKPALTPQDWAEVEEKLNSDLSANEEINSIAKLDYVRCSAEGCEFRYISFEEKPEEIRELMGAFFVQHQEFGSTLEYSLKEDDPLVNTFKFLKTR